MYRYYDCYIGGLHSSKVTLVEHSKIVASPNTMACVWPVGFGTIVVAQWLNMCLVYSHPFT